MPLRLTVDRTPSLPRNPIACLADVTAAAGLSGPQVVRSAANTGAHKSARTVSAIFMQSNAAAVPRATALRRCESQPAAG